MSYLCRIDGCGYKGQTPDALAAHTQRRHREEMKPLPPAPIYDGSLSATRAALYLRVSTLDQHPENQLPKLAAFAGLHGMQVVATYVDKASGKDMDRPDLQRLIRDAATDPVPFDAVIYLRLSRLGRSLRDNIILWDYFQARRIATIAVLEPYDTRTPAGRMVRNVMASVAEYERENMLEQAAEGRARARAEGRLLGRHRAGCGILFPCPEGVRHKVPSQDEIAQMKATWEKAEVVRARNRDRENARYARKRAQKNPPARVRDLLAADTHGNVGVQK